MEWDLFGIELGFNGNRMRFSGNMMRNHEARFMGISWGCPGDIMNISVAAIFTLVIMRISWEYKKKVFHH